MKASVWLVIVGALIALLACLNEHVFYVPYYVILPSVILGVVCIFVGYARVRTGPGAARPTDSKERWRYYAILMAAVVIGIALGLLIFQQIYTDVPTEIRMLISVTALFLAGAFFGWDVFRRSHRVR
jgi:hypothetical protein